MSRFALITRRYSIAVFSVIMYIGMQLICKQLSDLINVLHFSDGMAYSV